MSRTFVPLKALFLGFCLLMTATYGQVIYQTKLQGDFAFSNMLLFLSGILGLISLACNPHFARISILASSAFFFIIFVYSFIITIASIGPMDSGQVFSPSIEELLFPLAIGALSGFTFLANFARETDQDSDTRAEGR